MLALGAATKTDETARLPPSHLLLCGLGPNRPQTGISPAPELAKGVNFFF